MNAKEKAKILRDKRYGDYYDVSTREYHWHYQGMGVSYDESFARATHEAYAVYLERLNDPPGTQYRPRITEKDGGKEKDYYPKK